MAHSISELSSNSRLLIIYTGGTIGMVEDPETGVLRAFDFSHLQESIPELKRLSFKLTYTQFSPPIDSADMSVDLWYKLAQTIVSNYDNYDGFVVLHGTDTMCFSASALSFLLVGLNKPVIFTGSQLPIGRLRTDGKENLITSLQIAAEKHQNGEAMVPDVCIYFNGCLFRANRTTKSSADQFEAFQSYNYPLLAHVGIDISYHQKNIHRYTKESRPMLESLCLPNNHVTVLKLFPGIREEVVDATLGISGLKGLVLETYGSGNAPTCEWFITRIEEAVKKGLVVVNVTQCASGSVQMMRYDTGAGLLKAGVISGYDMTTESALTKLMCLLAKPLSVEEVRRQMEISLCGEMSNSTNKDKD